MVSPGKPPATPLHIEGDYFIACMIYDSDDFKVVTWKCYYGVDFLLYVCEWVHNSII